MKEEDKNDEEEIKKCIALLLHFFELNKISTNIAFNGMFSIIATIFYKAGFSFEEFKDKLTEIMEEKKDDWYLKNV